VSDIEAPADPKNTATYRAAKLAVIVLSALIILALIGLVVGFAVKLSGKAHPAGAAAVPGSTILLPAGAKILKAETQPGRLILSVQGPGGDEIEIYNLEDGALITRIKAAP
jgi:uncharacterized protein DUF6476